jgi:hypothetical protein
VTVVSASGATAFVPGAAAFVSAEYKLEPGIVANSTAAAEKMRMFMEWNWVATYTQCPEMQM